MGAQQHRTRSCWNTVPDPQWLGAPERAGATVLTPPSSACPETSWAQSCSRALKQGEFAGHLLNEHLNELGAEPAMSLNEPSH